MSQTQITRAQLLEKAQLAEQEERSLLDQLDSIPARVAEAKESARQRYNVMFAYKQAGHSTDEPVLDLSEAEAIAATEDGLKAEAKAAGLRKLRLHAAYWRDVERERQEVLEAIAEPLADLEEQKRRIDNDTQAMRAAQSTAERKRLDAYSQAISYERAATFHEQTEHPIRRM